ncbi:reverse transcriptase N-terminal domain-containing protein, partial [Streptomyces mirabilis]|uniref:reverse transcriptase N-terminal domain-containing protein n=1 Tax=Streptomyces mirabilis TaxID=68239 RepID=UPI0033C84536
MTTRTSEAVPAVVPAPSLVNGPEDLDWHWDAVDWGHAEAQVRRLRQRIFKATQEGDLKKVRNLQKLMLRSFSNTLVSVRKVAEVNAGRLTPGIDGRVITTSQGKTELVQALRRSVREPKARPVRRVYVAKANGKRRPLGIPVIVDRVRQARVVNALEPEWESRFEPRSYGFRPGRGCHDAIETIFTTACGKNAKRLWVLDADLKAAFDRISHDHILNQLDTFPARKLIHGWLKAGVVEPGSTGLTPVDSFSGNEEVPCGQGPGKVVLYPCDVGFCEGDEVRGRVPVRLDG